MSDIQNKLKSLEPYVRGLRLIEGTGIVDVIFKKEWVIPSSDIIKKQLVDKDKNYYMFFSEDESITLDNLLEYVESIINKNIENELKNELLKEYVKKLQTVFNDNNLDKLKRLEFNFSDDFKITHIPTSINVENTDEEGVKKNEHDTTLVEEIKD